MRCTRSRGSVRRCWQSWHRFKPSRTLRTPTTHRPNTKTRARSVHPCVHFESDDRAPCARLHARETSHDAAASGVSSRGEEGDSGAHERWVSPP